MNDDRQVYAQIPLEFSVLCVNCNIISNSTGDRCKACDCRGGLLSLARVLERKDSNATCLAVSSTLDS